MADRESLQPGSARGSPLARISHDQNFKNLILDYPRHALEFFAAEEAPGAEDDVDIVPVRQEQLQQRLGRRYHELDVPLRVEWVDAGMVRLHRGGIGQLTGRAGCNAARCGRR